MFRGYLRRRCALLLLGGVFYVCPLDPVDLKGAVEFSCILTDFLSSCFIVERKRCQSL